MNVVWHELKRNKISLVIWSAVISFMLTVSIMIYPEMSSQMNEMGDMFSQMGSFSEAFGMTDLNFGEFMGYFGVECGNVLGLGGAFFSALLGIAVVCKEEKEHTAEFLLTHPVSRVRVVTEKYISVIVQIVIMNVIVATAALLSSMIIGEKPDMSSLMLIFLSYLILQIQIGTLTFGISAFLKGGAIGIGLGISFVFYFANIISNLTDELEFLKFLTPFGYADSAYIINNNSIEIKYLLTGALISIISIILAYLRYNNKDIL